MTHAGFVRSHAGRYSRSSNTSVASLSTHTRFCSEWLLYSFQKRSTHRSPAFCTEETT